LNRRVKVFASRSAASAYHHDTDAGILQHFEIVEVVAHRHHVIALQFLNSAAAAGNAYALRGLRMNDVD